MPLCVNRFFINQSIFWTSWGPYCFNGTFQKGSVKQASQGFHGGSDGKESACNTRDPGLGWEDPLERRLQYSCLENPMDRGAWWATPEESMGSQRVGHHWVTNTKASSQSSFVNLDVSDFLKVQHKVLSTSFVIKLKKKVRKIHSRPLHAGVYESNHHKESKNFQWLSLFSCFHLPCLSRGGSCRIHV